MGFNNSAREYYLERAIDRDLWKTARAWVQSKHQLLWTSLDSGPGHGTTFLLDRLRDHAETKDINFKTGIRTIAVRGDDGREHPPDYIGPLASRLYEMATSGRISQLRKLKKRFRQAGVGGTIKIVSIVFGFLLIGCFVRALEQYISSPEMQWISFSQWSRAFLFGFLPENLSRVPFWFFMGSIGGLPMSMAILYMTRDQILPNPIPDNPGEEEMAELRKAGGLADLFLEVCDGWRGALILIDDAHRLTKPERNFLFSLFGRSDEQALVDFRNEHSILIVTSNSHGIDWKEWLPKNMKSHFETLEVPPFELVELQEVIDNNPKFFGAVPEGEIENLLQQSQGNIKVLFSYRDRQLIEAMGQEFTDLAIESGHKKRVMGLTQLMAYFAVRQTPYITDDKLSEWMESVAASEYLSMFELKPPQKPDKLLTKFTSKTSLIHTFGENHYFNLPRCQALVDWLKENSPHLLAEAHYFWLWHTMDQSGEAEVTPATVVALPLGAQKAIREAAWHGRQLGRISNGLEVLDHASGLTAEQREQRYYQAAAVLISAAALSRREGDVDESNDLLIDALKWLSGPGRAPNEKLAECLAGQFWGNFWLSGDQGAREQLSKLAAEIPALPNNPAVRIHQRFEEVLRSPGSLSPAPPEPPASAPELCNLHRLTETLWGIKHAHGFIIQGLRDTSVIIHEPVEAVDMLLAEFHLRQLEVMASMERDDEESLIRSLGELRDRLSETAPGGGFIGDEALHDFNKGRYWHLLIDYWRKGLYKISELPEEERESARAKLTESLESFCLTLPEEGDDLASFIWEEARYYYERSLQIAALLQWSPLILESSFHQAVLLQSHTPEEMRTESPPWWEYWDALFTQCLKLEQELQWMIYTPVIHRIRWEFFKDLDRQYSVEDANNTLEAVRRANYPIEVILDTHKKVCIVFTNYGDSEADRKRCAELYEIWARELVILPEAAKLLKHTHLQHEQADSLQFAAQQMRLVGELDHADRLLDESESLMAQVTSKPDTDEEVKELRNLEISLTMQRAWLRNAQGKKKEYEQLINDIWRSLRFEDQVCSNVLDSLMDIERGHNLLRSPWPMEGMPVESDPENENLSLPKAWFEGPGGLQIKNRFEFRFCQLLRLISMREMVKSMEYASDLRDLLLQLSPERLPSTSEFMIAAELRWFDMNRFGNVALDFAKTGLNEQLAERTRSLIINLLEALRYFFSEIDQIDKDELEALRLLIHYVPASSKFREEYIRVLAEYEYLLKRELLVQMEADANWYAVANRVDYYLKVLVDPGLQASRVAASFGSHGQFQPDFQQLLKAKKEALKQAEFEYANGNHHSCLRELDSAFPSKSEGWVFFDDLRATDLWLRCTKQSGLVGSAEINRRVAQMRGLALRYIRQFSEIIREPRVQQLALELLGLLQKTGGGASRGSAARA